MSSRRQVLLGSNIIIYATTSPGGVVATFMNTISPAASVVSKIEVLGFHGLNPANRLALEAYFSAVTLVAVEDVIVERAIALRQMRNITLGDSIIAATAL